MRPRVRFAPSPTGTLHVGNLRTAWVSHRWAELLGAEWWVRFEDIDAPRTMAGSFESQRADWEALGLKADHIYRQAERRARHWALFERGIATGAIYPCVCTRRDVAQSLRTLASAPHAPVPVYDGKCRNQRGTIADQQKNPTIGWRFRGSDETGREDLIVARTAPTFAPKEDSYVPAYNWACAIDDADDRYDLIVRAWDLRGAVEPQRALQRWIADIEGHAFSPIAAFHTAVVTDEAGVRLEKRMRGITLAEAVARGIDGPAFAARCAPTFRAEPTDFAPGKIWGEEPRALPLSALGL